MFGRKGRKTPLKRKPLASLEDLRDDCIALFLNSGLTQKQVHERGGPTPQTITRWLYKETVFPRMDTIRGILQALGADVVVLPKPAADYEMQDRRISDRLGLSISVDERPQMPPRPRTKKRKQWRKRANADA